MIFATAQTEPAVFLMLSEQDVKTMRDGRTKFIDPRHTGGATFNKIILSLHKTDDEALKLLGQGAKAHAQLQGTEPIGDECKCDKCNGVMAPGTVFEGRCAVCWATEAKAARLAGN